jgi:subtilisin family serine protease
MQRFPRILIFILALAACGVQTTRSIAAAPPGSSRLLLPKSPAAVVIPGQYVVRFAPGAAVSALGRVQARTGARVVSSLPQLGIATLRLPSLAAARAAAQEPGVLWVEPNLRRHVLLPEPNDPAYNQLDPTLPLDPDMATWFEWDARIIQAHEGWSVWPNRYYTAGSKGADAVRIAVIDTGIDYTHPDFANAGNASTNSADGGQLDRGLDRSFFAGQTTNEAPDEYGHGTHVAGIAAAATNNARGVTGVGYNATVMSLKVLDASGTGSASDLARAIVYAADNGALIVNLSLGDYAYSQAEQDAVNYAWSKGTLCIAAAGNDGSGTTPNYPAALTRVLAVSATAHEERLALYSNWGDYVGVAAPGGDFDFTTGWFLPVYSTMPTYHVTLNLPEYGAARDYDYLQGTSMASPQVAGLAALVAGSKGWTQSTPGAPVKIWQAIQRGADSLGGGSEWNPFYGHGRINVYNTLNLDNEPNPRGAATGCVVGQVRYRDTAVQNATVRAVRQGTGEEFVASSRADGGYRIVNALAGTYTVTATFFSESLSIGAVEVTAGCDIPGVDFNIGGAAPPAPPYSISGRVHENGPGVGGVSVTGGGAATTTAANGSYTLLVHAAGTYTLTATGSDHTFTPEQHVVTVGPNRTGVDFSATRVRFTISGTVTDNGTPVSGVTVTGGGVSVTTGANGTYALSGLVSGTYTVTASKTEYAFTPAEHVVTVGPNRPGVNFSAARVTYSISGTIRENGAGLGGVTVNGGGASTTTAGDGSYTLTGIVSGVPTVRPSKPGYAFDPVQQSVSVGPSRSGVDFAATQVSSLTLTAPNGGEDWQIGSRQTIAWTSTNAGANVRLEYSLDGGGTWLTLVDSTLNDGSHPWDVLCEPTTQAVVRVSSTSIGGLRDAGNATFVISDAAGGQLQVPKALKFGRVRMGSKKAKALVIKNRSRTQPLRVTVGNPAIPYGLPGGPHTVVIPPRGRHAPVLEFIPQKKGTQRGLLNLSSSDPRKQTARVNLTGSGR